MLTVKARNVQPGDVTMYGTVERVSRRNADLLIRYHGHAYPYHIHPDGDVLVCER